MAKKQRKYRLAILDDTTLREVFHWRVSTMSVITMLAVCFVLLIVVLSLLIVHTPIRNILPGYSESLRQQLIVESARVDSLQADLTIQRQYLDVLKQVTAGEIQVDSAHNLDSLQLIERAQIQQFNSEATDEFMAQYELKERTQLSLFDANTTRTFRQLIQPVQGAIVHSANIDNGEYGVAIRVPKRSNVLAVSSGMVVSAERMGDNTFTIVQQDGNFVAVYRQVAHLLTEHGKQLNKGDIIGLMEASDELILELWDDGKAVNPQEVMAW